MIKLLRIDDRLLHGQVAFAWTKNLGIHLIYVLNDVLVNDEITKMTLGIAKPYGTKLSVYAVDEGIEELKKHVKTNKNVMIIINNVKDAQRITAAIPEIRAVNFGGIKEKPGVESKRYTGSVTLTMEDIEICKQMREMGVAMEIKAVPDEKGKNLNDML